MPKLETIDTILGEVVNKVSEGYERYRVLGVIDKDDIEPRECVCCDRYAEKMATLRIEGFASLVWDVPFCRACLEELEAVVNKSQPGE